MPCPTPPGPRPSFIPVPQTARAVLRYTIFGQTVENVFHWTQATDYDATDCAVLAAAIVTAYDTEWKHLLSSDVVLNDVTVTGIDTVSGAQAVAPAGITGTHATAGFETIGNTLCFKFGSAQAGRSYRGRMYWPQLISTMVANNEVNTTDAGILLAAVNDFFDAVNSDAGMQHCVVSYQNDCEWRTTGVATSVISYTYTDRRLDSQRRRLSGRGI